jgi:hypothetical protein
VQPWVPKHATHRSARQYGVPLGQSLFWAHTTHVPSAAQILPVCDEQSVLARHCTHEDVVVLQSGVAPPQEVLLVHPPRQVNVCGSQMGLEAPQSALLRHSTHWPAGAKQRGAVAGQSVFTAQATQLPVVVSQMGSGVPAQSVDELHWTQTPPLEASQMGVALGQSLFCVHAAWHWSSPGQHEGAAAPQSLFEAHATHCPLFTSQMGVGWSQSLLTVQSTQPSVTLHV